MDWLGHFFGLDNGTGVQYLFWSGVGSDISEIVVIGAAYSLLRKHNCSVTRCFRIGLHPVPGTSHVVCRKHHPRQHPSEKVTHQQVLDDHAAAMKK